MSHAAIPFDDKAQLGYVWLIWGLTPGRGCDLIAIATSHDAKRRYLEVGRVRGYYRTNAEKAFVDHLYGDGLLTLYLNGQQRAAAAST